MALDEHYFQDFKCVACGCEPFETSGKALRNVFEIEDLIDERCTSCGHAMSLVDLEAMTHYAEVQMIRSLFCSK